jgi:hypothetical protein
MQFHVASGSVPAAQTPIAAPEAIWEAAHFYRAKGPTIWSAAGWNVMKGLAPATDARMLFIDDVHGMNDVSDWERQLDVVEFSPDPEPTHVFNESDALDGGHRALSYLRSKKLPRTKRAREYKKQWICSGLSLTNKDGIPLCLMYDLGLTWMKWEMGFSKGINVLPHFYENQQRGLLRLVKKALPEFHLRVILHDAEGNHREIFHADT